MGFVTVRPRGHWSGPTEAYVGEPAVGEARINVDTGAANHGARGFYAALGFQEEGVALTRALSR